MRTLSQGFIEALNDDEREYLAFADITLSSGDELHLTNSEIWSGGFSYEEAVSGDESFTALGSTIIGSATLIINNIYEDFSEYVFDNAEVILSLGMEIDNEVEKFTIGTYMVDDATYNGATIQLKLLDYMAQFDRPYSLSNLTYPATLEQIFTDVCLTCGIEPESFSFPRRTFSISTRPVDEALTCRDILSWVATIAGCFAKITPTGRLELKWFDYEHLDDVDIDDPYFHPWNTGDIYNEYGVHYLYNLRSQNVAVDDIVISGVLITVRAESEDSEESIVSYKTGTDGYVITVDNNSFLSIHNGQTVVNTLGPELIGTRFRKLNITQDSDPSIQAGDVAIVRDRKGNLYKTLITRVSFSVGSSQTIVCGAETPARNSATQYSSPTKAYVESRKLFTDSMTAAEFALESAIEAGIAAREAQTSAVSAYNSAVSANISANNALTQLGIIEDVSGTLRWISEHGTYVLTEDITVDVDTVYFELINGEYIPIAQPDKSANPSEEGWYVLDVTDSQSDYIMKHLAVTFAGLWVLPNNRLAPHQVVDSDGNALIDSDENPIVDFSIDPQNAIGYKVLLSNTGMTVYNNVGAAVANYGETTTVGAVSGYNVHIDGTAVKIRNGTTVLASYGATTKFFESDGINEAAEIGSSGLVLKHGVIQLGNKTSASDTTNSGTYIDANGNMATSNIKVHGGEIGGWTISDTSLYRSNGSSVLYLNDSGLQVRTGSYSSVYGISEIALRSANGVIEISPSLIVTENSSGKNKIYPYGVIELERVNASSYISVGTQGYTIALDSTTSGNRGVYDSGTASWIFYKNSSNNAYFLGQASSVSDLKKKSVITDYDWKVDDFIRGLKPIAFYRKAEDGTLGDRVHYGFGAQDVKALADKTGLENLGVYHAKRIGTDAEGNKTELDYHGEKVSDDELSWSLVYEELIAPMVLEIQRLMHRVDELEVQHG